MQDHQKHLCYYDTLKQFLGWKQYFYYFKLQAVRMLIISRELLKMAELNYGSMETSYYFYQTKFNVK